MTQLKYLNVVLTVIAAVLIGLLLSTTTSNRWSVVESLSAQGTSTTHNVAFSGVANPRKFFFWDQSTNTVYVYDDGGRIDAIYSVGKLGEPLTKQR